MKCDGLKAEQWLDYSGEPMPCYPKAKVDAAIAELKAAHHKERHEYIEMVAQLKAENERLKDELDAANNQCENLINSATDIMLRQDKVNAAKCDEVESLKATHYAEMVDAGMENRKLKRALWLARAERAADRERIFYFNDLETMLDIDGFSYDSKKKKGHKKLTARLWRIIWQKVERKCRAKAKEYK